MNYVNYLTEEGECPHCGAYMVTINGCKPFCRECGYGSRKGVEHGDPWKVIAIKYLKKGVQYVECLGYSVMYGVRNIVCHLRSKNTMITTRSPWGPVPPLDVSLEDVLTFGIVWSSFTFWFIKVTYTHFMHEEYSIVKIGRKVVKFVCL